MKGLTINEKMIIDKITEIQNLYIKLEQQHPSDMTEWITSIHNLQKLIGVRILRREHPTIFRSL